MRKRGENIVEERIKFKKGFQNLFIEGIKKKSCKTWKKLAEEIGVSEYTINFDWRNEKSTIPLSIFNQLMKMYPFEKSDTIMSTWVEKVLDKNWRQQLLIKQLEKRINYPKKSEDLAELFGVILGDGHLQRKMLTITGNSFEIEHYIYLSRKFKKLFNLNSKIRFLKDVNYMQLNVNSTALIRFLLAGGFVLGNKIKNRECLPKWIFRKREFVCGALRGLLDTDGGIYQKQKKYKRAIVEFQTRSPHIRADIYRLIRLLGLNPSKSSVNVRIQDQTEVKRFLSEVGCANPKNILRCKYFIETGEIPLKEKLNKELINLKVNKPFKAALV